jgi:hypothetical protein
MQSEPEAVNKSSTNSSKKIALSMGNAIINRETIAHRGDWHAFFFVD